VFPQEAPKPKDQPNPAATKLIEGTVKAISEHYLRAQMNPLWNIARDNLLAGSYHDVKDAAQAIQKQLPGLGDSELNLLSPAEINSVLASATGKVIGIGLADFCIDQEFATGRARVVTPLAGSPAMLKGIEPSDVILAINGKATSNMSHEQAMDMLRDAGTEGVRLQLERGEKKFEVALEPSSEKLQALRYEAKRVNGRNIGYIRVTMFVPELPTLAREAITALEQKGVEGYVLDLRNNPGGFLSAGTGLAGLFAKGTMGYKEDSHKKKDPIETAGAPVTDKPLAVIVNTGTASAAEFVSAGFRGLRRAQLVGVQTYGRGQAQIFYPLSEGYGVQVPAVLLLTVDGQSYKGKGIEPDIEVKQPQLQESQLTGPQDKQFHRAAQALTAQ
jgi:carboxyl-terminal processing protease